MDDGVPLTVLQDALTSGEVPCPIRQGIIAIESCLTTQTERAGRCRELECGFMHYRYTFQAEMKRARGEKTARAPAKRNPPGRPRKQPGKRAWQT